MTYHYCPVCGYISHLKRKCEICGAEELLYGEEDNLFPSEEIRKQVVYNNPLYNPELGAKRVEHDQKIVQEALSRHSYSYSPKCPACGSSSVKKISAVSRGASILGLGLFSNKINKTFKCNDCGMTF